MSNPNAIGDAVLRIQELLRLEQWELAEASCRELVQVAPDNSGAWLHLAFAIEHCGGLSEAEWALREAIRLDARSADGWTNLSAVLHTLGKEEEAEHSARKAVAFDGSKAEYWFNLSLALDELDRWEEASDAYRECLARDPGSASAWNNLGLIEQKRGRLDAARSAYERCLAIAPNHADAQFNLANLSRKQDGTKEAAESLEVAASVANARMYVARGNVHLAREEFLEAERHYRQALRIAPANFAARFNLANALLKRRSVGEAEAIAQQLVAERPDDPEVWGVYSAALQVPGCWEKGLAARRQALARSPSANRHSSLLMGLQYADDPTAASLLPVKVETILNTPCELE